MTETLTRPTSALATEYKACRVCGSPKLSVVLDLGEHAVSDFYHVVPADETRAPLRVVSCGKCGLVQLSHSVDKDRLYRNYHYRSSINERMVLALRDVVDEARQWVDLQPGDTVVDIGANDGTLLNAYPTDVLTVGYDPSNIEVAVARHIIRRDYYPPSHDEASANARVVTSVAMFYDVDNPAKFVRHIKYDLHPDGIWICQMMDLDAMLRTNAVDNICAEHTVYWSVSAFADLCIRHGLRVVGMSRNATNGGSVRLIVKHDRPTAWTGWQPPDRAPDALSDFGRRAEERKAATVAMLRGLHDAGKTVLGLGASTKLNTLLQFYGITTDLLPAIADRDSRKWGTVTAGQHIPVIAEEEGRACKPDYFFIGPWHFLDALKERESDYLRNGGHFIVPLPDLEVI